MPKDSFQLRRRMARRISGGGPFLTKKMVPLPTSNESKSLDVGINPLVVALAFDGMALFEFSIAVEIFGLNRPEVGDNWYRFQTAALEAGPLRTTAGLHIMADGGLERLDVADIIIIPSWRANRHVPVELCEALQRAYARGARIVSICTGVFAIAAAGLLDGRRATTHWRYTQELKDAYPSLSVLPDVLYVDDGQIMTSAGSAAGIDLCLHIVRTDYGVDIANKVACRLVVPPHRDGGQAQFIPKTVPTDYESDRLGPLLDYVRQNMAETHTVSSLAARAGMSPRTFLRRFEDATGTTPAKWLQNLRLQTARDQLEASTRPIEAIAAHCGFGTAINLRHHFRARLNTTPKAYRQAFQRV